MGTRLAPDVYSPAAGDVLIGGAQSISQFGSAVHNLGALCGETAAEVVYAWKTGSPLNQGHIYSFFQQLRSQFNNVGATGSSYPSDLAGGLTSEGVPATTTTNWQQALQQAFQSGGAARPVILDVQSPTHDLGAPNQLPGDERGVTGHFITVTGYSPSHNAYVVADSDNLAARSGKLVYYSLQQLKNAGAETAVVPQGTGKGIAGGGPGGIDPGNLIPSIGATIAANQGPGIVQAGQALNPASWLGTIQGDIVKGGWLLLAAFIVAAGLLILLWPQVSQAAQTAGKAGAEAAIA